MPKERKRGQRPSMVSNGFEIGVDLALDFLQSVAAFERVSNAQTRLSLERAGHKKMLDAAGQWRPLPGKTQTERLATERFAAIVPVGTLLRKPTEELESMKQAIFKGAFYMFETMMGAFGDTQRERHLRKTVRRWMDGFNARGARQQRRTEIARSLKLGNESSTRRLERRNASKKATMLEDIEPRALRRRIKKRV